MKIEEFHLKYPKIELATHLLLGADQNFRNLVCFHNYYERVLKRKVDVVLHCFAFDFSGKQNSYTEVFVGSDTAVQVQIENPGDRCGLVAVAVVPLLTEEELLQSPFVLRWPQSVGFYMLWENEQQGKLDTSHEWESVRFSPMAMRQFFVCLPASLWIDERFVYVYNPSLFAVSFEIEFAERKVQVIELNPMAGQTVKFDIAKDKNGIAKITGSVGAPLSIERGSQAFHVHHL